MTAPTPGFDSIRRSISRRDFLAQAALGLGSIGLARVLADAGAAAVHPADAAPASPLLPKAPHFPAKARRFLHIFLNGGPSQVDTFDPKPMLDQYAGKALPYGHLQTERRTGAAFPSPFKFKRYGRSGLEVSELFDKLASAHADDLCIVRSMQADIPNHIPCFMLMNCGDSIMSRPSMGSWITYGLGTENQNLPGFVVLSPGGYPTKEVENWQSSFLPPIYQGTYVDPQHTAIDKLVANIRSPHATTQAQREQLDLLRELDGEYRATRQHDPRLEARIQSFEMAYRMQMEASDAFDFSREPRTVRDRYGHTAHGRQFLIARRLLERGVRVVQLYQGGPQPWDAHGNLKEEHTKTAAQIDGPMAALLADLKASGLLDETLVLIGGEFGRTPTVEIPPNGATAGTASGRDHNNHGFSVVLAGGGVKGGHIYGATDEFGFKAVENPMHVHDLHATLLHLLGFDHEKLTYRYAGRDFRLTDVHGNVAHGIIA
jgi:hypothetical protein